MTKEQNQNHFRNISFDGNIAQHPAHQNNILPLFNGLPDDL